MGGPRIDEIRDNCFRLAGRINSTWGGNLCDMVRSTHYLRIIQEEGLVENAGRVGDHLLDGLHRVARDAGCISEVRGRGLMAAFTLPSMELRDKLWRELFEAGVLVLRSGEQSLRLRPVLDVTTDVIDEALRIMRVACKRVSA